MLEHSIALVTGASRGIGEAIATKLSDGGYYVYGTATTEQGVAKISATLEARRGGGMGLPLNVDDPGQIDQLLQTIKSAQHQLAVLVNNAGITRDNLLLRMKDQEIEQILTTNLLSLFRLSRGCLRDMIKARYGRIINIGSVVGSTGNPGQTNYAAAKAGLLGFTKSLAAEVAARGITVNAVAPGFIDTDMTRELSDAQRDALCGNIPAGRLGDVDDVAEVVWFLAGPGAGYLTGQTIHVNGGMFMP